jgi:hypothetical protein
LESLRCCLAPWTRFRRDARLISVAAVALLVTSPALAEQSNYSKVGNWGIFYDTNVLAGSCMAFNAYQSKTRLWFASGYSADNHEVTWGMVLRNPAWTWTKNKELWTKVGDGMKG